MVPSDDAGISTISCTVHTCSKRHLHNTKRENLAESTGVVPAKYPPKVKSEFLTTLECQSGSIMHTLICEVLGFLQWQEINLLSLGQKSFPYRSLYECIWWNPFLVGVLLSSTKRGTQDNSLYMQMWDQAMLCQGCYLHLTHSALLSSATVFFT